MHFASRTRAALSSAADTASVETEPSPRRQSALAATLDKVIVLLMIAILLALSWPVSAILFASPRHQAPLSLSSALPNTDIAPRQTPTSPGGAMSGVTADHC